MLTISPSRISGYRRMEILDLGYDTLRHIFGFVAQSGGENLVRVMTVCKVFQELGNDTEILMSTVFRNTIVSDNLHLFQEFNGVMRKAAQSGSASAQFLLAKVILMSSTQLPVYPSEIEDGYFDEDMSSSDISYASDDEMSDVSTTVTDDEVEEENEIDNAASMFLSKFVEANNETPSKSLHHYHFIRVFWSTCSPHDLSEMKIALRCYHMYFTSGLSYVNSLLSKFVRTSEKLSTFLKGMEELQKYQNGPIESDNQEVEIMEEASNQEEQHYDLAHDFVQKCRTYGKSLQELKNEKPDDKDLVSIIDRQFDEHRVFANTLTSKFEELRCHMLPVFDKPFCNYMDIDQYPSTN